MTFLGLKTLSFHLEKQKISSVLEEIDALVSAPIYVCLFMLTYALLHALVRLRLGTGIHYFRALRAYAPGINPYISTPITADKSTMNMGCRVLPLIFTFATTISTPNMMRPI